MRLGVRAVSTVISAILVALLTIAVVAASYAAVQQQVEAQRRTVRAEAVKQALAELGLGVTESRTVSISLGETLTVKAVSAGLVNVVSITPWGSEARSFSYSELRCDAPLELRGVPLIGNLEEAVVSDRVKALAVYANGGELVAVFKPVVAVSGWRVEVRLAGVKPGVVAGEKLTVTEASRSSVTLRTPTSSSSWTWSVKVETPYGSRLFNVPVQAGYSGLLIIEAVEHEVKAG